MSQRRLDAFVFFCFAVSISLAQTSPPRPIAITHVNVVDVVRGEIRPDQTVVIANGKISATGPAASVATPRDAVLIAGDGEYLIPGLWDMHVHLRSDQT